jgi:hypothetical protein
LDISGVRTMVRTVNIMVNVRALVCIVVKLKTGCYLFKSAYPKKSD